MSRGLSHVRPSVYFLLSLLGMAAASRLHAVLTAALKLELQRRDQ